MKRWICAIAIFLLAGCSAVPSVPTHLLTQRTALPDLGGAFSVNDSGTYTRSGCGPFLSGHFLFGGSGVGTFIHSNKETGFMGSPKNSCTFSGNAKMVSNRRPANSITMTLGSTSLPCFHARSTTMTFTINGGTGKFAQATGSGTVVFTCGPANAGNYTDVWSGTITF